MRNASGQTVQGGALRRRGTVCGCAGGERQSRGAKERSDARSPATAHGGINLTHFMYKRLPARAASVFCRSPAYGA